MRVDAVLVRAVDLNGWEFTGASRGREWSGEGSRAAVLPMYFTSLKATPTVLSNEFIIA